MLVAGALGIAFAGSFSSRTSSHAGELQGRPTEIVIGALLSLTGDWSTLGNASQAALALAEQDINAEFAALGSPAHVRIVVADTKLQPDLALQQLQSLAAQGIKVVVGPQSSAEIAAIKDWANANGVIIISQSSTASSLAIPDDNVLRFVPDDRQEGRADATLIAHDGIQAIVPISWTDAGNQGLHDSATAAFTALGGNVMDGVSYSPATDDFSGIVESLATQVRQAEQQYGAQSVGVYMAGFDESIKIFDLAANDPALFAVRWYGSDGVGLGDALLADPQALSFLSRVGFPNPIFGLDEAAKDKWQPLVSRISARIGYEPDAFAITCYDIAWISALAYGRTDNPANTAILRDAIIRTADKYNGATGSTSLNAAGDRSTGVYDFWDLRTGNDGSPQWVRTVRYVPDAGIVPEP